MTQLKPKLNRQSILKRFGGSIRFSLGLSFLNRFELNLGFAQTGYQAS